jgi:hypothetical protein
MKKLHLINPDSRIVLSGGRGDLHNGNITDEKVKELIKENPNYASQFHEVEVEEPMKEAKKVEKE